MNLKEQLIDTFALCVSNNCLEDICLPAFEVIDDQQNLPCRLLIDGQSGQFRIENPCEHNLHFLKIDNGMLLAQDGSKCDFAVFNADEIIFVELKKIEANTMSGHRKRKSKRNDAYEQLENTLKIFQGNKINLSGYQLFVIASVLDYHPPVTKMPSETTKNQNAKVRFEAHNAILLIGHTYQFT